MQIEITNADNYPLWIDRYTDTEIKVNNEIYTTPFALAGGRVIKTIKPFTALTVNDFLLDCGAAKPEIILLGTGKTQQFLPPRLQVALYQAGTSPEVMLTASACTTFNLLQADHRRVWAWFWF